MLGAPAIRFFAAAIESVSPSRALPRLLWHLSRMGGSWAGVWAAGNTRYHPRTIWLARHPLFCRRTHTRPVHSVPGCCVAVARPRSNLAYTGFRARSHSREEVL